MKQYKILRVCPAAPYQDIFSRFYQSQALEQLSYEKVIDELCKYGYLIPGTWSACMKKLGHESVDILPDFPLLQKKWAEENGRVFACKTREEEITFFFEQIESIRPDVLFFYAGGWLFLPNQVRAELKQRFPFIKIVTGLWGDTLPEYESYARFRDADLVFCAYEYLVKEFQEIGIKAELHGNCFDPLIRDQVEKISVKDLPSHDFIFAGSSGYGFTNHKNRYLDLLELMKKTDLKGWCFEPKMDSAHLRRIKIKMKASQWMNRLPPAALQKIRSFAEGPSLWNRQIDHFVNLFLPTKKKNRLLHMIDEILDSKDPFATTWNPVLKPLAKLFPDRCFASQFGIAYFELLRSSKLVFNRHTDEDNHAGNIRMFEVTGMGSCLITDKPEESKRLFKLDEEIIAYSCVEECIEKVSYLLNHEKVRQEIAQKGQKRTLKDHTVMNRCMAIHEVLQRI